MDKNNTDKINQKAMAIKKVMDNFLLKYSALKKQQSEAIRSFVTHLERKKIDQIRSGLGLIGKQ